MMNPTRLLIADDHRIIREGLKQVLSLHASLTVVGEASNGEEVLDRLAQGDVDLLLLDMTMPGLCGEGLILRLRELYPKLPILVLSMHNEPSIAQRALRAGASGYLTKDRDHETLVAAIRRVSSGSHYLDPILAEQMAFDASGIEGKSGFSALTEREFQVMRLLASGRCVNDIAGQLSISKKTVSTHKARLMEKMSFASNADLVRYAVTHGLV